MLPEVFECPQCERQFVIELVEPNSDQSIYCPQCKRYLGEKDVNFVLLTEIEELSERLRFERDRLEKDEAVYALGDCAETCLGDFSTATKACRSSLTECRDACTE